MLVRYATTHILAMNRFSLRDAFFTVALLALLLALIITRRQLRDMTRQVVSFRNEMRYLTIGDPNDIHAINIPAFGEKQRSLTRFGGRNQKKTARIHRMRAV